MRTTFSRLFTLKDAGSPRCEYDKLVRNQAFRLSRPRTAPSVNYALLATMTQHATRNTQHATDRGATGFGVGGMAVARRRHAPSIVGL